ncbi:MAG: hypothetical protein CMK82_11235 [Pseudomonadales bacterium]|nr:hypothetical protein [Pseudomonadales bacterium]MBS90848.1 hypothetical protein [Sphingobium sp.]
MNVSCTVETRRLPSGRLEVLLKRDTGYNRDAKSHRQLFELEGPEADKFETHLRRLATSG